ncbi:alpha/beta fold hydrolase [Algoriphagus namhaensis]
MKLNFKKAGSGPPLVILHGLFGSADNWFTIARELQALFTLYLVDQRNHGDSPHSDEWNYSVMVDDLLELFDDEGLDKAFLMGHSMGGKTAMNFALAHPDRVERLIVADIAPRYYPVHHEQILEGLNSLPLKDLESRKQADEELAKYIKEPGIRQFLLKSLGRDERGFVWKINLPVITKNIEEVGQALEGDETYEGKTLFLAGAKSDYITDEDYEEIYEFFPNYQLVKIPDAGHWLHAEQPADVVKEIKNFLK